MCAARWVCGVQKNRFIKKKTGIGKVVSPFLDVQNLSKFFAHILRISRDAQHEVNLLSLGEGLKPLHKSDQRIGGLVPYQLEEIIHENIGYIIVACMHAAEHALEQLICINAVCAGINKAGLIRNVIGELALLLNDDHIALTVFYCFTHHVNELLGLTGTLQTHQQLNHVDHAPLSFIVGALPIAYQSSIKKARAEL